MLAMPTAPIMLLLHVWLVLVSFALLVVAANSRVKDLKVQDRVIRLEERLRFAALLPPATSRQPPTSPSHRSSPSASPPTPSSPPWSPAPWPRT